ncbi:MAG: riboflavin synthase [Planctomycetes bacterium]|nr:riboflavin synthase [Planctomycetota bacterium]
MFTGLIKGMGTIRDAAAFGKGRRFRIDLGGLAGGIAAGQSVAVNGVCLTVTVINGSVAAFDAVSETLSRTNLGLLKPGDRVNLEPALKSGDALDGHIVLGHIDVLAKIIAIDAANPESRVMKIALPGTIRRLVAEKGSIAVDGISLTVMEAEDDWFTVAIIPHSLRNSTLAYNKVGDSVNLEADILARYTARILESGPRRNRPGQDGGSICEEFLRENGFA